MVKTQCSFCKEDWPCKVVQTAENESEKIVHRAVKVSVPDEDEAKHCEATSLCRMRPCSCRCAGCTLMPIGNADDDLDPMADFRRGHQSGKPSLLDPRTRPSAGTVPMPKKPATPSKYFGNISEADRQRAIAKVRARNGGNSSASQYVSAPRATNRPSIMSTTTKKAPPPKPAGPMSTADAMTASFKKKTSKAK